MNKYQEALDRIGRNYYLSQESGDFEHFENLYLENKKTLQELVDKATPKKPKINIIEVGLHGLGIMSTNIDCPCCGPDVWVLGHKINKPNAYRMNEVCSRCGQALDWSEE